MQGRVVAQALLPNLRPFTELSSPSKPLVDSSTTALLQPPFEGPLIWL